MNIKGKAKILHQDGDDFTKEWEFEYNGKDHIFRIFDGSNTKRMWLDGEEVNDYEEDIILDDLTGSDIYEECVYQDRTFNK